MDDSNPFAALIAQAGNEPTALDSRLRAKPPQTAEQPKTADPVIVLADDSSEGQNIGLGYRQPSFSSLTDVVITKGGEVINSALPRLEEEDPVIVFDRRSNSSNDDHAPIGLSVRQPSFVSLHGEIIPKGSDSLKDFQPVIEEVEPREVNEDIEEDDDPQVVFVRELKVRNMARWKAMGYEPPNDLLTLARASSQAMMRQLIDGSARVETSNSQKDIPFIIRTKEQMTLPAVNEDEEEDHKMKKSSVTKSRDMMEEVIQTNPSLQEYDLRDIPESSGNEEEDALELPPNTHFLNMDPRLTGPPVRRLLATGEVRYDEDIPAIRERLREIIEVCSDHLWIEETKYVNELLILVNQQSRDEKVLGFRRENPMDDLKRLNEERETIAAELETVIGKIKGELNELINHIDEEYKAAAAKLDEKYQNPNTLQKYAKPSKDLLELRVIAKRLLKQNRINEAAKYTARIRKLEMEEEKKLNDLIREKYYEEDRKMKEAFAKRREILITRYRQRIKATEKEHEERTEIVDKRIAKLEVELEYETPMDARWKDWKRTDLTHRDVYTPNLASAAPSLAGDEAWDFAENGVLVLTAPAPLRRQNDIEILDRMTEIILESGSPKKANVDVIYREAKRSPQ